MNLTPEEAAQPLFKSWFIDVIDHEALVDRKMAAPLTTTRPTAEERHA
jgi:hypothetical protein